VFESRRRHHFYNALNRGRRGLFHFAHAVASRLNDVSEGRGGKDAGHLFDIPRDDEMAVHRLQQTMLARQLLPLGAPEFFQKQESALPVQLATHGNFFNPIEDENGNVKLEAPARVNGQLTYPLAYFNSVFRMIIRRTT
jgi:hypothetical protein